MRRQDIRCKSTEEKEKVYDQVHVHYLAGKKVTLKEHRSGFPAVTVDCEDIHVLSDILSLEEWWWEQKQKERR